MIRWWWSCTPRGRCSTSSFLVSASVLSSLASTHCRKHRWLSWGLLQCKISVHIFSRNHKDSFSAELDLWRSRELHRGLSRERACNVSHPIVVSIFVIIIIKPFTIIFFYNNNDLNQERNSLWLPCLCKLDLSIHCCCSWIKVTS